jgi:hypothetical protein
MAIADGAAAPPSIPSTAAPDYAPSATSDAERGSRPFDRIDSGEAALHR